MWPRGGGIVNGVEYSAKECYRKSYELELEQNINEVDAWSSLAKVSLPLLSKYRAGNICI